MSIRTPPYLYPTWILLSAAFLTACATTSSPTAGAEADEAAPTQEAVFHTQWDTTEDGSSDAYSIQLPLTEGGEYDFAVDWGDGTEDHIVAWDQPETKHRYETPGIYDVRIQGTLDGWAFDGSFDEDNLVITADGDQQKLLAIHQWGGVRLADGGGQFIGASSLTIRAQDAPDLEGITNLSLAFARCASLQTVPGMAEWNVSNVNDMSWMFYQASSFNQPLEAWDVSNVTTMDGMFLGASSFDQPLDAWDVSNVTDIRRMFAFASSFNQSLEGWDVSNVNDMRGVFAAATSFNQPLEGWDVSNVTRMVGMFNGAASFNQPLEAWDVSNVTQIGAIFGGASSFNQPLQAWDVSNVNDMRAMFSGASSFNQPLEAWDVSNVKDMAAMFSEASSFDQPLEDWDVSNVNDMTWMFSEVPAFEHCADEPRRCFEK